jgi:hypothetical protein
MGTMKIKFNVWLFRDGSDIHIVDVVNGMLITESHGASHKRQIWKEVKE